MPTFDEAFYLASNPDVAAAVARGEFSSGLEHFQRFGQAEGRLGTPPATGGSALSIGPLDFEGLEDRQRVGTVAGNGFAVDFSENAQVLVSSDLEGGDGNFRSGPVIGQNVVGYYDEDSITLEILPAPGVTFTSGQLSFLYGSPNVAHEIEIEDGAGVVLLSSLLPQTQGPGDGSDDFNPFEFITFNFAGDVRTIEIGSEKRELGLDNIQLILQSGTAAQPQPPVASDDRTTINASVPATINVLGNDFDPDNALPLAVIGFSPLANGTGTLLDNGNGTFSYRANVNLGNATDSFIYTIADGQGLTDSATVTLSVVNNPPVATDEEASTNIDTAVQIDVLANDLDPDADAIAIADFPATTGNGGTVVLDDNGTPGDPTDDFLIYTPADGFTGTDSFTYSISDGRDGADTATVTVRVGSGLGSLSGTVFQDDNGNGVQEDDEDVLSGVTVFLDTDNDGELDSDEESLVTDADGNYSFTDLEPSVYIVREVVPDGFTQTFPSGSGGLVGDGFADVVLEYFDSGAGPIAGPYGVIDPDGDGSGSFEPVSVDVVLGDDPGPSLDALSLPTDSFVTVGLIDEAVIDGPGDDIFIQETGAAGERAEVFVSSNFTDFTLLGIADDGVTTSFDLADIAFDEPVRAVRIVGLDNQGASPGFDVVNVQVLPQSIGAGTGAHVVALEAGEDIEDLDFGNIENDPPVAIDDTATTSPDSPVAIDVLSNDFDIDGNTILLTFFGATSENGGTVTRDDNGTPDDLNDDLLIYSPPANFTGTDSFSYTISDGNGGTDSATVMLDIVTGANSPPVALDDSATTNRDSTVTIDVLANDLDIDGNPISLTGFEATSANGGTITLNDNSTPNDLTDDRLVYTPAAGFTGTDSFDYTIGDGSETDTGTVTVRVSDGGPTSNLLVTGSVSNGTPSEGETITYTIQVSSQISARNISLRSLLPAGLNLQYTTTSLGIYSPNTNIWTISTLPAGRTATLEVHVQVGVGLVGQNLINVVEVISPSGVDNQGSVEITIAGENSSPIATDDRASTARDTPVAVDVSINDFDLDGDSLEVAAVGEAANGEVTIVANEVVYTPDSGFTGTDSFIYTIDDGRGGTDTATVSVTVGTGQNQAPTAVADNAIATVGQTISIDVLANDFDLDGDAIALAAFQRQTMAGGTVVRNNNGTPNNRSDDFLEYTPAAGFTGTDSFAYRIQDGQGGTDTARVTVTVNGTGSNQAPIVTPPAVTTTSGISVSILVQNLGFDPEGDLLSISSFEQFTVPGGSVIIDDNGTLFDASDDFLIYTPGFGFTGTDSFSYTVADSFGLTASATLTVSVTGTGQNQAPIAIDDFVTGTATPDIAIFVLDNDSDPDGDLLSISGIPVTTNSGGTVNISGNTLLYNPAFGFIGTENFNYTISDGRGGTATATVTVTTEQDVSSISGATFSDPNVNGIKDEPERGLAGFTVFLDGNNNGNFDVGEADAITSATGGYFFPDLLPGTYNVRQIPRSGFQLTSANPVTVTLVDGEDRTGVNFGNLRDATTPPIAGSDIIPGDDFVTTDAGSSVAVAVLANDVDQEGDALTIIDFEQFTSNGGAVSIDTNGTPFNLSDDLLVYSPTGGFTGTDSFRYTVSDQKSNATATVTVNVVGTTVEDGNVVGTPSNDDLVAGAGNDSLTGGLGNDTLTGGEGSDRFVFNSPSEGVDTITDFDEFGGDRIAVSAAGFGAGLIAGNLDFNQFTLGAAATDPNQRFIYGINDGNLFFDADGSGPIAQVQIATLSGGTGLSSFSIIVL